MAFLVNINYDNGLPSYQNAYAKVTNLYGNKEGVNYCVSFFANKQIADVNGKRIFDDYNGFFVPSVADEAPNFIKQAYEHLKTLTKYANSTDC